MTQINLLSPPSTANQPRHPLAVRSLNLGRLLIWSKTPDPSFMGTTDFKLFLQMQLTYTAQ